MSEMKAGRELDALVAEMVMGFKREKKKWEFVSIGGHIPFPMRVPFDDFPNYSTDISAAWDVVKKFAGLGFITLFSTEWSSATRPSGPGWACQIDGSKNTELGETAPHAICLAALKAVENGKSANFVNTLNSHPGLGDSVKIQLDDLKNIVDKKTP
jgi:hypothetical protein